MEPQVFRGTLFGKRPALFAVADTVAPDQTNTGWMQLFVGRKWVDPSGEEMDLSDPSVFESMLRNFSASEQKRLSVDYDHRAWHPTHPDSEAAGWITKLEVRDGPIGFKELWAQVEWTAGAAQKIRDKAFQYCSPAFVLADAPNPSNKTGADLGAQLLNVALTNVPFQDGLAPIKLSLAAAAGKPQEQFAMDPAVKPAEGDKPATETPAVTESKPGEQAPDPMVALGATLDRIGETAGTDRAATCALMNENADKIGALLRGMADTDGTPAEVAAMKAAADEAAKQLSAKDEELRLLKIELSAKDTQLTAADQRQDTKAADEAKAAADAETAKKAEIETEADRLVAEGFALDTQRPDVVAMLTADKPRALRVFSRKVVPIGVTQAGSSETRKPAAGAPAVTTPPATDDGDPFEALSDDQRKTAAIYMAARQATSRIARPLTPVEMKSLRKDVAKRVLEHDAAHPSN